MTRSSPARLRTIGSLIALALLSAACNVPDLERAQKKVRPLAQTTKIYDADGRLIINLHAEEDRLVVPYEMIPTTVKDAVVAIEDQRYWSHRGIDIKALLRAAYVNVTSGEVVEGGSTITEQFVKNRLVGTEQTLDRKVKEAILAWQLEKKYSKEEILAKYLNTVYFGRGAYGIQRAARTYFSAPIREITLRQAALLAGLIAGPARYDPFQSPGRALDRRNAVLGRMHDLGMISEPEYRAARDKSLGLKPEPQQRRYPAPWFVDYVKRRILTDPRFGKTYRDRFRLLFEGGLRIHTTLDLDMQEAAEEAVRTTLTERSDPYAALTAISPSTGFIKAMVGGRNYFVSPKRDPYARINLATGGSTGRQAGSAFKPFTLVAALESGIPPSRTYPAPSNIVLRKPPCGSPLSPWPVSNYSDASYGGAQTVEKGTVNSVNVVYAQIISEVGPDRVVDVAHRMGIQSELSPFCSLTLGTSEVNTLEMASAFGTLATTGMRAAPEGIKRVENPGGKVLYEAKLELERVLDQAIAWTATRILEKVVQSGTGTAANIGRPQAGKTGTADDWRDAWFVGFVPQLSTAVWVGFPQGQVSMCCTRIGSVVGGSWPAQIWHAFVSEAVRDLPVKTFDRPAVDLIRIPIDVSRGCAVTTPSAGANVRYEEFVPGTEPPPCDEVGEIEIPSVVGMEAGAAYELLQSAGLAVTQRTRVVPAYPSGTVVRQAPPAGSPVTAGSSVTLVVAA